MRLLKSEASRQQRCWLPTASLKAWAAGHTRSGRVTQSTLLPCRPARLTSFWLPSCARCVSCAARLLLSPRDAVPASPVSQNDCQPWQTGRTACMRPEDSQKSSWCGRHRGTASQGAARRGGARARLDDKQLQVLDAGQHSRQEGQAGAQDAAGAGTVLCTPASFSMDSGS